jgi:NADPH:quinone reductase-like Zn-dependent oxidoreductase/acyl carrier protein
VADALARGYKARLVLTQRTALPPEPSWTEHLAIHGEDDRVSRRIRQVQALRGHGAEVVVAAADASDARAMQAVIDQTIARFGVLHGVFHGAGVAGDGIIQVKTRAIADGVLVPKVKGLLVLDSLLRDLPLDFVALFSSIAAVTGGFGQVDYCGANSFLDVFAAGSNARRGWPVVSINWDAWSDVGMAVETVSRPKRLAAQQAADFRRIEHPYFTRVRDQPRGPLYLGTFSAARHWFLREHRLLGTPTFPGTAYLELARSAFAPLAGASPVELRDLFFLAPFAVADGEDKDLELLLERDEESADGEYEFVFRSRPAAGADYVEHCRGRIAAVADAAAAPLDIAALDQACSLDTIENPAFVWDDIKDKTENVSWHLALGARWANLRCLKIGDGQELAYQSLPDGLGDSDTAATPLHPALLDFTGLMPLKINGTYIPFSFDTVRVFAPLTPTIVTSVVNRDDLLAGGETIRFDATIADPTGRVLVEVETMTLKRIDQPSAAAAPAGENFRVVMDAPGLFSSLVVRPVERPAPAEGQIEIEIAAAGLNFKDVLRALGMIPDLPGGQVSAGFGGEAAGRVSRVGAGVSHLRPGDEVMAIAPGAFGAYAITLAPLAVPVPAGLSWQQAAAIPMVFLTAYHALVNQARLRQGERVLIHAAAGGVGLAAIEIAKHIGAEIYATASAAKHDYLKSLGIEHVANSRSLDFADDIRTWTGGEGVDVVLNSLSGEFIPVSLALLRPSGRFVEIGARDIYANSTLGLRPFANNLSFSAIDLGPLLFHQPEMIREMFLKIAAHLTAGDYRPLPVTRVAIAETERAFEMMAAARHIGKIVIDVQPLPKPSPRRAGASDAGPDDVSAAISPREGIDALMRILATRQPQVVVSPKPLLRVIEWQRRSLQSMQSAAGASIATQVQHARPDLATPFAAPRTDAERGVAAIWQDLLGITEVGVHDSFFELGGDSLIGVQVLSRIKKAFSVQLSSSVLYEGPTVESLAKLLAGEPGDAEADAFASQRGRAERRRQRQQQRQS